MSDLRIESIPVPQGKNEKELGEQAVLAGQVQKALRDERGRLLPGQKLNPKGRPKLDTVVRSKARSEGLNNILKLIELRDNGKSEKIQLAAVQFLHCVGFGKPRDAAPLDDEDALESATDVELDDESLSALLGESK